MAHLAHYKEAHPMPFVITHWINLISMIMLICSGFYIHYPLFGGFMDLFRGAHLLFAFVVLINLIVRIILAFILKSAPTGGTRKMDKDYKVWLPQADNKHQGFEWIKYYLFFRKTHPLSAKYGVPQKIAYLFTPILILFMGYTGFCLWEPTCHWGIFSCAVNLVGSAMTMRLIHYFAMWVMILFMIIHIYLATIDGFAPWKIMFAHIETGGLVYDPDTHQIVGEDWLGGEKPEGH